MAAQAKAGRGFPPKTNGAGGVPNQAANGNVKSFLVVIFFILFISLLAGGMVSNADLTPDTPQAPVQGNQGEINYDIFGGSDSSAASGGGAATGSSGPTASSLNSTGGLPVSGVASGGACGSTYAVMKGDTLSRIARSCGTTLQTLLALNPSITNPNLIQPGQQINLGAAATTAFRPAPAAPIPAPVQGLRPGGSVSVRVINLPAGAVVEVTIGPVGAQTTSIGRWKADDQGTVQARVKIPSSARTGQLWAVTVLNQTEPAVRVSSSPFQVE